MQLNSIQVKIALWAGLCLMVTGTIFLTYSAISTRNAALDAAEKQAVAQAQNEAAKVNEQLSRAMDVTRTLAHTMISAKTSGSSFHPSREGVNDIIKQVLTENPQFVALYADWEPNAFDNADAQYGGKPGYNPDGRFNFTWSRDEKGEIKSDITPPGDEDAADWYQVPKKAMHESIIEPYPYTVQGKEILETTVVVPMIVNGKFFGVVGADLNIQFLQNLANQVNLYEGTGKLLLVSNQGKIAGLTGRPDATNKALASIYPELSADLESIKSGRQASGFAGDNLRVIVPLSIGASKTPWAACILIPKSQITSAATALLLKQILIFALLLSASLAALWFMAGRLSEPIKVAMNFAQNLAAGRTVEKVPVTSDDETGELLTAMNSMLDSSDSLIQSEDKRNQMQSSIIKLLEQVDNVANGDLTKQVSTDDEFTGTLGDSFNFMILELRRIISQVQNVTHEVTVSAMDSQLSSTQLARAAEEQTTQIIQTTKAIQAMTGSMQNISQKALLSATVAQQSLENANEGTSAVNNTIEGMNRIREQVQDTSKKLKRLGESSQEIGEIVQIIGGISKRTSYLALNASIQAAEAGEAGYGFAVVAEEVDRLAKRAAEATKRINGLVKTIQIGANQAISAMEESTREVVNGSNLANQAGHALGEIKDVSSRLAELIQTISESSAEQSRSSQEIAGVMHRVTDVTRSTADGIRKSNTNITKLSKLADDLRDSVSSFKLPKGR